MRRSCCLATVILGVPAFGLASAASQTRLRVNPPPDLAELDLEELLKIKVTSVSKRPEDLFSAATAIDVITAEDLHRSGATSIAEALRLSPGLHVARVDSHTWAISARGFNGEFASKLLVLMDGRSVYTPLFSGVYWDVQDTLLQDIDRIEVIRGPGATVWGANAVNGVINIITKSARDTQGVLVYGGGGTEERGFGGARYGGRLGSNAWFRVYGKYFNRDDFALPNGADAGDSWHVGRGGFRVDWEVSEHDLMTLQGDLYGGRKYQTRTTASPAPPFTPQTTGFKDHVEGGNVLGRWSHEFSDTSDFKLQLYYDRTQRESALPREDRDTFDVDFDHRWGLGERQRIVWGLGYRVTSDETESNFDVTLTPARRTTHLFSAFVQDEITLVRDRLFLTVGTKVEHNDFVGFEVQPSGRLAWTPTGRQTVWAAVSRAVRTPSRAEDDARVNTPFAPAVPIIGTRSGVSEELLAYELGYRVLPHRRVSLDVAGFYNVYDDLRNLELGAAATPSGLAFFSANQLDGETYGVETAVKWQMTDWWRWHAAYTYLRIALHRDNGNDAGMVEPALEGNSPRHQMSVRSSLDLPAGVQFDAVVRYVDVLRNPSVPSYVTLDLRLAWKPTPNWELAIVGQNLLDRQHPEFAGPAVIPPPLTEVQRSVYGQVTWRF